MTSTSRVTPLDVAALIVGVGILGLAGVLIHQERRASLPSPSRAFAEEHWAELVQGGGVIGSDTAKNKIVIFTDYECDACRDYNGFLTRFVDERKGDLAVVVRQNPLRAVHFRSEWAALAALCSIRFHAFPNVNAALFTPPDRWAGTGWASVLDTVVPQEKAAFQSCIENRQEVEALARDVALAGELEIRRSPSTFINGKPLGSMPTREALLRELKQ